MIHKETKKDLQKRKILAAAMEVWAKTEFRNTSLSLVARRLCMTKQAFYRYFSSKQDLLKNLTDDFTSRFLSLHDELLVKQKNGDVDGLIKDLINGYMAFFKKHKNSYLFLVCKVMENTMASNPVVTSTLDKLSGFLKAAYDLQGIKTTVSDASTCIRYLLTALIFFLSPVFIRKGRSQAGFMPGPAVIKDNWPSLLFSFCSGGVMEPGRKHGVLPYAEIEKTAAVTKAEMPQPDRILNAIEEVVAEAGFGGASLERIAQRLDMTKSSLYFHFRNKDDMLGKMIAREQAHFMDLAEHKVRPWQGFASRSYAFMVLTGTYALNNRSLFTVFNWLRFQNLNLEIKPPDPESLKNMFFFAVDGIRPGEVRREFTDYPYFPALLLNILTFRTVIESMIERSDGEGFYTELRKMHTHYLYGMNAYKINKGEIEI